MCLSQKEHCGAAPNHVQTPAPTALQHHSLLPPHLPHLGAALCLAGGLVQGARPAKVGVSIDMISHRLGYIDIIYNPKITGDTDINGMTQKRLGELMAAMNFRYDLQIHET